MMKHLPIPILTFLMCLVSGRAHGEPSRPLLHPLFSDHAVIQRDAKVPVWGWAEPGVTIRVSFAGQNKQSVAGADGKWTAHLDPMSASSTGRPLEVRSDPDGKEALVRDVLVGDVWICSGQSNMEMGLSACGEAAEIDTADFPHIRLLTVPRRIAFKPETTFAAEWLPSTPENLTTGVWGGFSAVAWFFGKELHRELGVPIGLIHSSWGGSPCEAWMSGEQLAPLNFYQNELAQVARVAAITGPNPLHDFMDGWYQEKDPGTRAGLSDPVTDVSSWNTAAMPSTWNDADLPGYEGIVWLRKTFELPTSWQGKELVLSLGAIADVDTTWINGKIVGRCDSYETPRSYPVPAGVLRPGENILTLRVMNAGGGGFMPETGPLQLAVKEGTEPPVSLAGPWHIRASATRAQTGAALAGNPGTPSVLYNGMIAPLLPYAIQGAIWYQGEANTADPARYRTLLPAMIRDWRSRFGIGDFSFHIVSLANYQPPGGGVHDWPALREAQAATAKEVPRCGFAVAIDIGDAKDIHPKNKREVGRRLALSALANTHGRDVEWSGPWFEKMEKSGQSLRLTFAHTRGGLSGKGESLTGFTVAGEDRKFVDADAVIDGETVVVSSPLVKNPVAVRYAWAANPSCNLTNAAGLPAVPFRTDDWALEEP